MPAIVFTIGEVFEGAVQLARALSDEITKLADIEKSPLNPGESPDARRHQIAKLGKKLAEAFIALDEFMTAARGGGTKPEPSADTPTTVDPEAN